MRTSTPIFLLAIVASFAACSDQRLVEPLDPAGGASVTAERCDLVVQDGLVLQRIEALRPHIERLRQDGALNAGQARSLENHLDNAGRQIEAHRYCPARAHLAAFREQVDDFVRDGVLTHRQAHPLYHGHRMLFDTPVPGPDVPEAYAPGVVGELRTLTVRGEEITYEVIDGLAIFQSDIILGYADELESGAEAAFPTSQPDARGDFIMNSNICDISDLVCARWTDGVIGYAFANNWGDEATNANVRAGIEAAIQHWRDLTGMRFERRASGERVVFRSGSWCSSWIGRNPVTGIDPQWIDIHPDCPFGTIVHEIGHTVGIYHEHSRNDRDHHVSVDMGAIPTDALHNYYRYLALGHDIGRYDHGSIMHYPCMRNGVQVIRSVVEGVTCADIGDGRSIGQRDALSEGDILSAYTLYPVTTRITGALASESNWRFELTAETSRNVVDDFIYWTSDSVEGDIGTGRTLVLEIGDLPPGRHDIRARVEVFGEVISSAHLEIRIYDPTPSIRITSPEDNGLYPRGSVQVWFEADARVHPGTLHEVTWTSSRDGHFLTGNGVGYAGLSIGDHSITAMVADLERGLTATSDPIRVSVYGTAMSVEILEPATGSRFCMGELVHFAAIAENPNEPGTVVPDFHYRWTTDPPLLLVNQRLFSRTFFETGGHRVTVRAGLPGDVVPVGFDHIDIEVDDCAYVPPTVAITVPSADTAPLEDGYEIQGFDETHGMWYVDIVLEGSAEVPGLGPLAGERLVWTTNQTGIQEGVLGTGTRITARLFTDRCEGRWHDIRLTASSDDTERNALRRIHIWSVC